MAASDHAAATTAPGCPECLTGERRSEPDQPHVHLTAYGYLVYAPAHTAMDYLQEIRAVGFAEGRRRAAEALGLVEGSDLWRLLVGPTTAGGVPNVD